MKAYELLIVCRKFCKI